MAFIQDPLRKITAGEPAIFITFCAFVFGASVFRRFTQGSGLLQTNYPIFNKQINSVFVFFICILILQSINSFIRFGSPIIPLLGFANYIAPIIALGFSYYYAATSNLNQIRKLLLIYLFFSIAALLTLYLELQGIDWKILGEVGPGVWISTHGGINPLSGTFRAAEIAAWHAATASALVIVLMTYDRKSLTRLLISLAIVAFIVSLGVLTGRRKFIVSILIFGCAYLTLILVFVRGAQKAAIGTALLAVLIYLVGFALFDVDPTTTNQSASTYSRYVSRTQSVFEDLSTRFYQLGIQPISWAYNRFGLLGAGLGSGTQGVGKIVDISGQMGGAAEGGFGKLMIELGLPGLLVAILLGYRLLQMYYENLKIVGSTSSPASFIGCGLAAILIANAASFSVATQAFGDFFILIFLGICAGVCLATPELARRQSIYRMQHSDLSSRNRSGNRESRFIFNPPKS